MTPWLRPATPLDAGQTGAILHGYLSTTPWIPDLYSAAETVAFCGTMIDRGWVTVAGQGARIAGFIARDGDEISALYVDDHARGQGIGAALLTAAQQTRPHLHLWTFQANTAAQRFYERHGFRATHRTDGAGNDQRLPDIHLSWSKGP